MTRTTGSNPGRRLSLRLLGLILLASSVVTLMLSGWQLWSDFQRDRSGIEERLRILETTTLDPLTNSVWALNEEQIQLLLSGMLNLEAIEGVELRTDQGRVYQLGRQPGASEDIVRRYRLVYRGSARHGEPYPLGELTVYASLEPAYQRLMARTANIVVGQALKTFVVSFFILLIVQHLVTRHLVRIADYARNLTMTRLDQPLSLDRPRHPGAEPDELDRVENAINFMRETLQADIARRLSAEERLLRSEARYRQLFETSIDGLAIFDLDGKLIGANPALLAMLGYPPGDSEGLNAVGITPPQWLENDDRIMTTQVLVRGFSDVYRKGLLHRDGHEIPVSVRSWIVQESDRSERCVMTMVRDITREAQLEDERERLQKHMNETQRLETVGTLAGGVAHEFNNLLTPIKGYAELLAQEPSDPALVKTRATAIAHSAERGRKLVEKILLLGRRVPAQHTPVNIATLVRDTLELAGLSRPPGVRTSLAVRVPDVTVTADAGQLHQAVMNLVINGFGAMPKGGTLDISIEDGMNDGRPGLCILVSDTGPMIAPADMARIFEPFFSGQKGRYSQGSGSGLGLAVAYGIVNAHGGTLSAATSETGTTFRIWLPRG